MQIKLVYRIVLYFKLESGSSKEIKLPQALEKVLAFKDVRAQEVGVTHEEIEQMNTPMGMCKNA